MALILDFRVTSLDWLTPDIYRVLLKPLAHSMDFKAGQYINIIDPNGEERPYSLANAPRLDGTVELHIRHAPGVPFMDVLFVRLQRHDIIQLHGSFGHCCWQEPAKTMLLVAGGTGYAPCKALLEQAMNLHFPKSVYLYWGVKAAAYLYDHTWLSALASDYPQFHYIPVVATAEIDWRGRHGLIPAAIEHDFSDFTSVTLYAFGKPEMVALVKRECTAHGLNANQFLSDYDGTPPFC